MKKILLLVLSSAMSLTTLHVSAASLTAEQALQKALSQHAWRAISLDDANMDLVLTVHGSSSNTLYVFSHEATPGFVVLAADDNIDNLVMGYSADSDFDPGKLPPALQWWLDASSRAVERMSHQGYTSESRSPKGEIAPIVKTKWDQESPYYDLCPKINLSRCVTGCVATAMAQVMKVHEWPVQGVGDHSYTYKYKDKSYEASFDFGATTFDWGNMLDVYDGSATAAQKSAVATLMYACGVASDMSYSPSGSGASDFIAACGMYKYFDYDPSLCVMMRAWFTESEWEDMIYGQLSKGWPVMYAGIDDAGDGHEFVCDGYDGDGYFHINWGWSGIADGYYQLYDLTPEEQGTGGGSGISGFNSEQNIVMNIHKPESGSKLTTVIFSANAVGSDKTSYSRLKDYMYIQGGFYSYSIDKVDVRFGVWITGEGIDDKYVDMAVSDDIDLEPMYGVSAFPIKAKLLPEGSYRVYPAYYTEDAGWQVMYYDKGAENTSLLVDVSSSKVNVLDWTPEGVMLPAMRDLNVSLDGRMLNVRGASELKTYYVYKIDGSIVYSGNARQVELQAAGVYVVRCGSQSKKIVVL